MAKVAKVSIVSKLAKLAVLRWSVFSPELLALRWSGALPQAGVTEVGAGW